MKRILLDECRHCRAVRQLMMERGQEWTARLLRVIQIIHRDCQVVQPAETTRLSRLTNTRMAIVRMNRSFLTVTKAVLNYAEAYKLKYGVSFAKARTNDFIDDRMTS